MNSSPLERWIVHRPNEPSIDATRHLSTTELIEKIQKLSQKRSGRVHCIVQRLQDGSRQTPQSVSFSIEQGLVGDRWFLDPKKKVVEQIAIMDWQIANVIANGQSLTLFGDNLFVDLDFANIQSGTQFSLGAAILEVTPEPHTGCSKFAKRFGSDALRYTCVDPSKNVRGVYAQVVQSGMISLNDRLLWIEK